MAGASARERAVNRLERLAERLEQSAARLSEAVQTDAGGPRQPAFQMFGLVAAWYEADIIGDCVRHQFAQGCERVFLIDNGSPDDTVEQALAAGAELAASYSIDEWDQTVSNHMVDHVMRSRALEAECERVWWLVADADEFHYGPFGQTVREHVTSLPDAVRLVGAESLNHFPTARPEYVAGVDARVTQPMSVRVPKQFCRFGHWKHPVVRMDRGRSLPSWTPHNVTRRGVWCEAEVPIVTHHIQYREEALTRQRLMTLVERIPTWQVRAAKMRAKQLDAVYAGKWDEVQIAPDVPAGIVPRAWQDVLAELGLGSRGRG